MTLGQQKEILVVEDHVAQATILKTLLESAGFLIHLEHDGAGALRYALEHQVALVILDLKLPDIPGYHVCRKLRRLYHAWVVPIVMLTGMDQPVDQLRGYAHGADAYLTKPYEIHELLGTITRLLGQTDDASLASET